MLGAVRRGLSSALWLVDLLETRFDAGELEADALAEDGASTSVSPAEVWGPAGYAARPKPGSSAGYPRALRWQDGDAAYLIATFDPRYTLESLEAGEVAIHALGKDGAKLATVRLRPDGSVVIDAASVYIGDANASEGVGLGDTIKSYLDSLKSAFDSHIHTTTATIGSSGTPGVISPPTSPAPAVPTVASSKHAVEP